MASGVREGSIIEGIMAMYIAMIFCDPDDGQDMNKLKRNINKLRQETVLQEEINPRIGIKRFFPNDDDLGFQVAKGDSKLNEYLEEGQKYFIQKKDDNPADYIQVGLEVYLKPAEVFPGFGEEFKKYIDEKKDYGKLAKKVDNLLESRGSILFRRLISAKKKFLQNKKVDVIKYSVIADGVTTEKSDGTIKADIVVKIIANGKELVNDQINISVKSDSSTVANLGVIKGLEAMHSIISPRGRNASKANALLSNIKTAQRNAKLQHISALFDLLSESLTNNNDPKFTDRAFNFIESAAFGDDMAQVVDVKFFGGNVKEIQPGRLSAYRKYGNKGKPVKLYAKRTATDIRIMPKGETRDTNYLYKFRFKMRKYSDGSGKYIAKVMVETGKLAYAK